MLYSRIRPRPLMRLRAVGQRRTYAQGQGPDVGWQLPPVRVIRPTVWALSASALIYVGCAAYSVHEDVSQYVARYGSRSPPRSLEDVEKWISPSWTADPPRRNNESSSPLAIWRKLNGTEQVIAGITAVNAGVFAASLAAPSIALRLVHTPAMPAQYTLLTSTFAHSGTVHMLFNSIAIISFGGAVGRNKDFAGSGSHLAAFYLSTGTLSRLGQHLYTAPSFRWPAIRLVGRVTPSLGASGALMAMLGSFCTTNPTAQVGIIFLPFYFQAQDVMYCLAAFNALGCLGLFSRLGLGLGHAAHLSGLGLGVAYTAYNGKEKVWNPARRYAFKIMRQFGLV